MSYFIWPSDQDRADNVELNRVCEKLEDEVIQKNVLELDIRTMQTEIDSLNRTLSRTKSVYQQRISELEAHAERIASALNPSIMDWLVCGMATNGRTSEEGPMAMLRELRAAMNQSTADSLIRRDLIKQAEVLRETADEFEIHERARQVLNWKADKLTHHAKALNDRPS